MGKLCLRLIVISSVLGLTACDMLNPPSSSYRVPNQPQRMAMDRGNVPTPPEEMRDPAMASGQGRVSTVVRGDVGNRMDSIDKSKFAHALDKPLGKSTSWTNANSGVNYAVVPVRKVTINGNSFCRAYQITASQGEQRREITGTACVAGDGQWQNVQ